MLSLREKGYIPTAKEDLSDDDDSTTGLVPGQTLPISLNKKGWGYWPLYLVIAVQTIAIVILCAKVPLNSDPSLTIWCTSLLICLKEL